MLKLGESVKVKEGVKEPNNEIIEMGGWQGRIVGIDTKSDKNNVLITIEWDSLTLGKIPSEYFEQSEIEGLDWKCMTLYDSDIDKTNPVDKINDVKKLQDKISDKYFWSYLGDEGKRISKILEGVNRHNEMKCLKKWVEYLESKLSFPISAIVTDSEEDRYNIKIGDKVQIKEFQHIVDMYGIVAKINRKGKSFEMPLCELGVIDKKSSDYQLIEDYRTWFSNK